jgi:acetoacetyl-CoA synthetase
VIIDSLVVGQAIQGGADERVILFVKLAEGETLSDDLRKRIREEIRKKRSPRHCPEKVFESIRKKCKSMYIKRFA